MENQDRGLIKKLPIALTLLAACAPQMRLGVVPYPDELLIARRVEIVWPLDDGHYLAISGTYKCLVKIKPWEVNEGDLLRCRWYKDRN
jgi:hypothetical protein